MRSVTNPRVNQSSATSTAYPKKLTDLQTSLDLAAGGGQDFAPSSSTTRARCPAPQAWARQGSRAAAPRPTRDRAFPSSGSSARSCWAPPTAGDVKLSSYHCAASASRRGEDFSVLQQ